MKKRLFLIYSWIIVSVLAQVILYLFVDKVYLGDRNNIADSLKVTTVSSNNETIEEVKEEPEISVDLPENASNVKVSYDGTYCSYILDKKLYILNIETKETKKVIENYFVDKNNQQNKTEGRITCYEWIPFAGKNAVMYGVSSLEGASGKGQVFTFDADTQNEHVGATFYENYVPRNGMITDIIISPQTMVYYARIKMNDSQDRFIRINIMDEVNPSITMNSGTTAKIGYFSEDLYYKDTNNKISVKSGFKSPYQLDTSFNPVLVGLTGAGKEGKDKIYLGSLTEDNKVDKIYYGIQGTDIASWQSLSLNKPILPENIVIKTEDEIYGISHEESALYNLKSGEKVTFNGKYVDYLNGHIAYTSDNKLKFKPIKKIKLLFIPQPVNK